MYHCCKNVVPLVTYGKIALRPVVPLQRSFWNISRPSDIRIMLRDVDRQMARFDQEMQGFFRHSPLASILPRSMPLQNANSSGSTYRINIDVSGYKPEDIKVSLKDRVLTIEAKMEQKGEDGSRLYQELSRSYTLPQNVEVDNLKSLLTNEGILAIEAPLTGEEAQHKEIPINRGSEEDTAKLAEKSTA